MITQAMLAMRGVNQRKHKEQHEEGSLRLQNRAMAYKGTETAWMRSLELGAKESWIHEPAIPDGPIQHKKILRCISCPTCGKEKNVEKYKVYGKVGFSRIKCMRCKLVASAQQWKCNCNLQWPKCETHILKTLMHAIQRCQTASGRGKVIKKGMKTLQGSDAAYPRRRINGKQAAVIINSQTQVPRTMMKAGSILAKRFPHLYARQV